MATSMQAALLDELMGRNRNVGENDKPKPETKWDDVDVCKYNLVSFCPHDLFINTKADLGRCDKLHDEDMKKDYQDSSRNGRMGYEQDFVRYLGTLVTDIDRKIRRGHDRLAMNAALANGRINSTTEERTEMLTNKINELVQQAEELGTQGNVEEAQGVMKLCDQLVEERVQLEQAKTSKDSSSTEFEKEMEVCEICGALLVVGDVQQRIDEHLMGKQHMGYARIRAFIESDKMKHGDTQSRLIRERDGRQEDREAERERRRREWEEADMERKKERDSRRAQEERRDGGGRRRSKNRETRTDSRAKSPSKSKHRGSRNDHHSHPRHRSRSREHRRSNHTSHQRSRSRDDKKRSRQRSGSQRRSKDRHGNDNRTRSNDKGHGKEQHHADRTDNRTNNAGDSIDRVGTEAGREAGVKRGSIDEDTRLDQLDE